MGRVRVGSEQRESSICRCMTEMSKVKPAYRQAGVKGQKPAQVRQYPRSQKHS